MAEGKWIDGLTAATPVAEAARLVLDVRLKAVGHYLDLALLEPAKNTEYVHQLRVCSRRAGAALKIFRHCLPEKAHDRAGRRLRRLRRAAGAARDWDVFLIDLAARTQRGQRNQAGIDFLIGYAVGQRLAAQADLEATASEFQSKFARLVTRTVAAVRQSSTSPEPFLLLDLARSMLADLVIELNQAATQDLNDYDHLHQVRIIGKRLRYAMEVFVDCFAAPFRDDLYTAVEEMQDILGRANDSHVAVKRLAALRGWLRAAQPDDWKRCRPKIESLLRLHQRRLPQGRHHFREWWNRWQESGQAEMLAGFVQPTPAVRGMAELVDRG